MRCLQRLLCFVILLAPLACDSGGGASPGTDTSVAVDTASPADASADSESDATFDGTSDSLGDTSASDVAVDDGAISDLDVLADAASDAADTAADTVPTLNPNGDSDRDGVFDLDEVDDGTDPFDPRSARGWHPEISGHPRLFFGPDEVATVAARTQLSDGPHAVLWQRIVSRSQEAVPPQPGGTVYTPSISVAQAKIAEAAAFRALLQGDAAMAAKAAGILSEPFADPTYLNQQSSFNAGDHYNLHESEALVGFCTAYDYLAAIEDLVGAGALAAARERLVSRIDYFRTLCFHEGGCRALVRAEQNNHTLKPLGALGLCAMAVPDRPMAAVDFNEAISAMDHVLNQVQGVEEGGYGENWNYLNYGGQTFQQLLLAYHRFADGAAWPLLGEGWVTTKNPNNGVITEYLDFAVHPTTRSVFQKMVYAARPDGLTPAVDDGNPSAMNGGLLAALFDDGRFLWNWQLPRVNLATSRTLTATFAALDPSMSPVEPGWALDGFFAEAGFSVLRSDLGTSAFYTYICHENGRVRSNGFSHEHADDLSFLMHAHGEPLIIDPGYINFSEHLRVKYGTDHNMVAVDGLGPEFFLDPLVQTAPSSDAWLHDWGHEGSLTTLIASTKYADAELRRRFVRVDGRYLVVADQMLSDAPRDYTWQLNGYGGGTVPNATFEATANGAIWARPNASVVAAVQATSGATTLGERLEDHLNTAGGWKEHVCLTADATMDDAAGFLSVVIPVAAGDPTPTIETSQPTDGLAVVVVHADDGGADVITLNLSDLPQALTLQSVALDAPVGLSWRRLGVAGEVLSAGSYSMDTPPIPDPVTLADL